METTTFTCENCGAELEYEPSRQVLKCRHCDTETELLSPEAELLRTADGIVPLTVDKNRLHSAVEMYMASGEYTPDDLVETAKVAKLEMMYVPAYLFGGTFEANWTASFGYDHTEHYTVHEKKYDYDLKMHVTRPVTKTKTVTDWHPQSGTASGSFHFIGYAGQSISSQNVRNLIENCSELTSGVNYSEAFTANIPVEPFTVSENDTFSSRIQERLNSQIASSVREHAQGDRQRDWHWNASHQTESATLYIPLCHAQFEYRDRSYDLWLDGTNASHYVGDALPADTDRKARVRRGFTPAWITLAAMFIFPLFASASHIWDAAFTSELLMWCVGWLVVIALFVFGFRRRSVIVRYSKEKREAALSIRQAERSSTAKMSDAQLDSLALSYLTPEKPFLARSENDKVVLPAATALGLIFVVVSMIVFGGKSAQNVQPEETAQGSAGSAQTASASSADQSNAGDLAQANDFLANLAGDGKQANLFVGQGQYQDAFSLFNKICTSPTPDFAKLSQAYSSLNNADAIVREAVATACGNVGIDYLAGQGVARDFKQAATYLSRSCDVGYLLGCSMLGTLYRDGNGVPQDYDRAIALNEKACDGNEMRGCANLGKLYSDGKGVPKDYERARALDEKACDGTEMRGCANLGKLYSDGDGVPQDYERARALDEKACSADDGAGCDNLGMLYLKGVGVTQDYGRAHLLLAKTCDAGFMESCFHLGSMFEEGLGGPQDYPSAQSQYSKACQGGEQDACSALQKLPVKQESEPQRASNLSSTPRVAVGQTPEQVIFIMGPPSSVTTGARRIYNYPHLAVVFVDGKVSEFHSF